jgi:hypothetical protein
LVQKLPWLDYAGQTAPELVACKHSHQIDSLFLAFEQGIQNRLDQKGNITEDEQSVLAVLSLLREVNDGGHRQFFLNSSRRFVPIIGSSLLRIHCDATAEIVADAIAALGSDDIHGEDPVRDNILADCDDRFYQINEIEANLIDFLEAHQDRIQLAKVSAARRGKTSAFLNVSKLYSQLLCVQNTDYSLEWVRCLAEDLAQKQAIPVTESELDGAAVLYALDRSLKGGDLAACEPLALLAFDLMRDHTMQSVLHRDWVNQLIAASQEELADTATLAYLDYLRNSDPALRLTQNRIKFWAAAVQEHAAALPNSAKFFAENFPGVLLDQSLEMEKKGAR